MSFASPIALLALLLVPLAIAGYIWFQRRREADVAAFVQPALLPNVVDRVPGWRRHLPAASPARTQRSRCAPRKPRS